MMPVKKNLDRFGNERYAGYRKEDFVFCPVCVPSGSRTKSLPAPPSDCPSCGGYGEVLR